MKNKGIILGIVMVLLVIIIIGVIFIINNHNNNQPNMQSSNGENTLANIIGQPTDADDKVKKSVEQK